MKEVYLLLSAIAFVVYIFATRDDPYIPIRKREKPLKSERQIINWYAWRGPMFIEDFAGDNTKDNTPPCGSCPNKQFPCSISPTNCGVNFVAPILSNNPTNLPSDPVACCQERTALPAGGWSGTARGLRVD